MSIRNIVAPVKELVKGTQAVASGQYDQQLPVLAQDDLGFLVESFNDMTHRIAVARDETRQAGVEVENQRAYLETILGNLTAGLSALMGCIKFARRIRRLTGFFIFMLISL